MNRRVPPVIHPGHDLSQAAQRGKYVKLEMRIAAEHLQTINPQGAGKKVAISASTVIVIYISLTVIAFLVYKMHENEADPDNRKLLINCMKGIVTIAGAVPKIAK